MKSKCLYLCVVLSLLPGMVIAEPEVSISKTYYSIHGNSEQRLRAQLNSNSPVRKSGDTFDAYTSWYVNWRFYWDMGGGRCFITKVKTTVDVKYILPEWKNETEASGKLRKKWGVYYEALVAHENGHKNFGIRAAREIEEAISNMDSYPSCTDLGNGANRIGKEIIDKYSDLEKEYDRDTNYGMRYGAKFP